MIDLKPGHIINEYSMATPDKIFGPKWFASYLVIETCKAMNGHKPAYKCMCLYNAVESDLKVKPGHLTTLVKEWITDKATAEEKSWPTFWEVA